MNILLRLTFLTFTLGLGLTGSLQAAKSKQSKQKQFSHEYMKNGVSIKYKEITSQESKKRLGHSFNLRRGSDRIIPIEVKITNHSSRGVNFSKDDLDLKLVSLNEVKAYVKYQARMERIWGIECSVLLAPIAYFAVVIAALACAVINPWWLFPGVLVTSLIVTAAPTAAAYWSYRKAQESVHNKMLTPYARFDIDYIAPNKTLTQVVYVKRKDLSALQG